MTPPRRSFLFLQGPISPFFDEVAAGLRALGHAAHRINLCLGDKLFWRGPGAVDYRGRAEDWPAFVDAFSTGTGSATSCCSASSGPCTAPPSPPRARARSAWR